MAGFNRVNFIKGPAIFTFDSQVWYAEGDIAEEAVLETWQPATSMHGKIDVRLKSRAYKISFKPAGMVTAAILLKAYPSTLAAVGSIGKSIFAATDKAGVIQTLAGQKHTYANCALSKMPGLKLSAGASVWDGNIEFLCLLKLSTEPSTEDSFVALAAQAFSDTTFDETAILSGRYTAAYGASPYDAMDSVDGFTFTPSAEIKMDSVDRYGLVDARLAGLTAEVKFTPAGLTEAQLDALVIPDGASAVLPGQSLAKADTDLVVSAGSNFPQLSLYKAGVEAHGYKHGEAPTLAELTFVSKRTWTAGVANELFLAEIA